MRTQRAPEPVEGILHEEQEIAAWQSRPDFKPLKSPDAPNNSASNSAIERLRAVFHSHNFLVSVLTVEGGKVTLGYEADCYPDALLAKKLLISEGWEVSFVRPGDSPPSPQTTGLPTVQVAPSCIDVPSAAITTLPTDASISFPSIKTSPHLPSTSSPAKETPDLRLTAYVERLISVTEAMLNCHIRSDEKIKHLVEFVTKQSEEQSSNYSRLLQDIRRSHRLTSILVIIVFVSLLIIHYRLP